MLKKYKPLLVTFFAVLVYVAFQSFWMIQNISDHAPTITFDDSKLEISVKDKKSVYLKGVNAFDEEDGDLSDSIIIENESIFINDTTREVTYLVFDSDDNVTRASRLISYKDYKEPVFSLNGPLKGERYSMSELMKKIHAKSSVDGDISNKITVMNTSLVEENKLKLNLSVCDSTNTISYLNVFYYLEDKQDIDIILDDYLIYLNAGDDYNFRDNIINVVEKLYQNIELIDYIDIDVPEMNESGIYEVTYSISRRNGNTGKTTMIVVVK